MWADLSSSFALASSPLRSDSASTCPETKMYYENVLTLSPSGLFQRCRFFKELSEPRSSLYIDVDSCNERPILQKLSLSRRLSLLHSRFCELSRLVHILKNIFSIFSATSSNSMRGRRYYECFRYFKYSSSVYRSLQNFSQ